MSLIKSDFQKLVDLDLSQASDLTKLEKHRKGK